METDDIKYHLSVPLTEREYDLLVAGLGALEAALDSPSVRGTDRWYLMSSVSILTYRFWEA